MSRSYRKPYSAICGGDAKPDRMLAARGVRRAQNQYLKHSLRLQDWDEFLIPHRYECFWNDRYSWGRDGKQTLQFPCSRYHHPRPWQEEMDRHHYEWWVKLHRK